MKYIYLLVILILFSINIFSVDTKKVIIKDKIVDLFENTNTLKSIKK